jgi:hypothetical protein
MQIISFNLTTAGITSVARYLRELYVDFFVEQGDKDRMKLIALVLRTRHIQLLIFFTAKRVKSAK